MRNFIMRNAGLDEAQAGIKIDGRNINNLRYTDETTLMAERRIHLQCGRPGFDPCVGKTPWRRAWQPTPVFLPGECPWTEEPGRPWGHKELDMTVCVLLSIYLILLKYI